MVLLLGAYAAFIIALLFAELREKRSAQILLKPLAALGFLFLALNFGALDSSYGRLILGGLIACAFGDVFLLSRNRTSLFRLGMLAFAVGHVFYIFAANEILRPDTSYLFISLTTFLGLGTGVVTFWKLKPKLPRDMVWPVGLYTLIISAMLIRSMQTDMTGLHLLILPAALLFAISDIFVARDRFVTPSPKNAWVITPLYFGAQALFALSVLQA
ncbi:lysoplasmalogenase [Litorimonas haliclonae]|uniref:lysoplasmalogenase n=1 Tax=Litorimonas haliclonae TaxID=2081977 RepID=UPI0039F02D50